VTAFAVVTGFGSHGIQVCFKVALGFGVGFGLGLGEGEVVADEPGSPFLTVITTWFSSSAVTEMHFSPSHSCANAGVEVRNIEMRARVRERRIGRN
jgi:hypothetical protein